MVNDRKICSYMLGIIEPFMGTIYGGPLKVSCENILKILLGFY